MSKSAPVIEETTLAQQIQEGHRIKLFLEDEAIVKAFATLESAAIKAWRLGDTVDVREAAHMRIRALDELQTQLKVFVDRGTWATDTLAQQQKRADRARQKPA